MWCPDQYGSPSLDEVGEFSRSLSEQLAATMGEEAAGDIEIEVSSAVSACCMLLVNFLCCRVS